MEINNQQIEGIIDEFLYDNPNSYSTEEHELDYTDKLQIILSESIQALSFVTTIEEEFDFELDDDEIDLEFFSSVDTIVNRVQNHLAVEG